jgi:hypothetical protein
MSTLTTSTTKNGPLAAQPARCSPAPAAASAGPRKRDCPKATGERIRARAYETFKSRNGGPGNAASDWLQAERELNSGVQGAPSPASVRPDGGRCTADAAERKGPCGCGA